MELLFIYLLRFSVINPIGTVPILLDFRMMTKRTFPISLWTAVNVFVIMIISFLGNIFVFSISMALRIAGGIVIATSGSLLSGEFKTEE
jgi:small neutral amino acid transporter SnatA (MarC family)